MGVIDSAPPLAAWREADLVAAVRAGEDAAYEELYRRYHRRVAGYVRAVIGDRAGVEDITQEVFLSALRRLRVTSAEVAFKPWILAIARNASIDLLRRGGVMQVPIDGNGGEELLLADQPADAPEEELARRQRLDHLVAALHELPERQRRVLLMRELEGLSLAEIAESAGLTLPAVDSTLFRARRELRETYQALEAGTRCQQVTAAIARLAEGLGSRRERRQVERHARRCAACRRRACELGVELPARAGRLAGLLPIPWLLGRRGRRTPGDSQWPELVNRVERARTWLPAAPQGAEAMGAGLAKVLPLVAAGALLGGAVGGGETLRELAAGALDKSPALVDERQSGPSSRLGGGGAPPSEPADSAGASIDGQRGPAQDGAGGPSAAGDLPGIDGPPSGGLPDPPGPPDPPDLGVGDPAIDTPGLPPPPDPPDFPLGTPGTPELPTSPQLPEVSAPQLSEAPVPPPPGVALPSELAPPSLAR